MDDDFTPLERHLFMLLYCECDCGAEQRWPEYDHILGSGADATDWVKVVAPVAEAAGWIGKEDGEVLCPHCSGNESG